MPARCRRTPKTTTWWRLPTRSARGATARRRRGGRVRLHHGFTDPVTGAHGGALMAPPAPRPDTNGRRRGHLRVLPDPAD